MTGCFPLLRTSFFYSVRKHPFRGFERWCFQVLEGCVVNLPKLPHEAPNPMDTPCEIEIGLVGAKAMLNLNRRFRNRARPTDILSFRHPSIGMDEDPLVGSLVLCPSQVSRIWRSDVSSKGVKSVYQKLLVHGFCHLLGFDHKQTAEVHTMAMVERFFMLKLTKLKR